MSSKPILFCKAEACGNDFLIVESAGMGNDPAELSRCLCDRHRGVGADGVEWVSIDEKGQVVARLFNADGSEAEISGNGTRCVAAWAVSDRGGDAVVVHTGAGNKRCQLSKRDGYEYEFEMDMGEPEVGDVFPIKLAFGDARGIL